jgi:phosphatidylglycerol:prolipoprotein diacylglycerol transferase
MTAAVIRIGIDPFIHLGPLTLAWHGLTIAIGIILGGVLAGRVVRELGMPTDPLWTIGAILALAAIVGGKIFFLAEHGELTQPGRWLSGNGFTFDGGFIAAAIGIAVYVWRSRLPLSYLDAVAVALPFGVAVGRVGDVINGEHHGPASTFFLAVQNTHPDAAVPSNAIAYHSGGLYEVLLAAVIFALVWPSRRRLMARPLRAVFTVLALFSVGRFAMFFVRSDSPAAALGLSSTQWTSLALLVVALVGLVLTRHVSSRGRPAPEVMAFGPSPRKRPLG